MKTHSLFDRIDDKLFKVLKAVSYISLIFLIAITALAFINVCGEKLQKMGLPFARGIPNAYVIIKYCNVPVVYLTAAYVTLERGQTGMDLLTKHYPPVVRKILAIIASLVSTAMIGFITYRGIVKVLADQIKHNTRIDNNLATAFPEWPFGVIYVLGLALLAFSFFWQLLRIIMNRPATNTTLDLDDMKQRIIESEKESAGGAAEAHAERVEGTD